MSRPHRIVHAIRSDGFAGVERHVCVLARAQADRGDAVTVIGGDPMRMSLALQDTDVTLRPGATVAAVTRALAGAAPAAEVIHTHMTAADFAAAAACLLPGRRVPIVSTRHFSAPRGQSRLGRAAAGFIAARVSAQVSISRYVAERIEGSSQIVYPGVEPFALPQLPREPAVLVVQRLEPEKRTDIAVAAFARSGLAEQGWCLRIVGDGSLRSQLQQQAADLGIGSAAEFLGMRADVPELMARAALMLAPCPIEGLGLGVLEAMAAHLPVVASAAGGHLETLPQPAQQYSFPANDAAAAAAALRALAGDSGLRHQLGELGAQRQQQHFTPAAQAAHIAAVYATVLRGDVG